MKKNKDMLGIELYSKYGIDINTKWKVSVIGAFDCKLITGINIETFKGDIKTDINVTPNTLSKSSWKESIEHNCGSLKDSVSKGVFSEVVLEYRKGSYTETVQNTTILNKENIKNIKNKIENTKKIEKISLIQEEVRNSSLKIIENEKEVISNNEISIEESFNKNKENISTIKTKIDFIQHNIINNTNSIEDIEKSYINTRKDQRQIGVSLSNIKKLNTIIHGIEKEKSKSKMIKINKETVIGRENTTINASTITISGKFEIKKAEE